MTLLSSEKARRPIALLVAASLTAPTLAGCGGGGTGSTPPPADATLGQAPMRPSMNQQRPGMSTKQKMVLLAGAAALYYMYKRKQNAQGQSVQYYRSETNGRIYYRDPRTKQAIYVTPPQQGIQVPADQAQEYSGYSGYQGNRSGREFGGYGPQGQMF
ncbi:MAG TPA: hypothetical protein VF600_09805 [Abditibacteriaceae bacterium]